MTGGIAIACRSRLHLALDSPLANFLEPALHSSKPAFVRRLWSIDIWRIQKIVRRFIRLCFVQSVLEHRRDLVRHMIAAFSNATVFLAVIGSRR